ncbi:hypothetical protein ACMZ6Z_09235, partial [Streptococcus pluranimalium]|uniref:hypothetical protein n=1 Tax=Streptococcus pluranimalium TaxID=82348 RepID=UPI0039FCB408
INPITGKPATEAEITTAKLYTPVKVVSNVLAVVALLKGPGLVTRYQTSRFSNLKTTSDVDLPKNNSQTIAEVTEQTTGNYISPRSSRINSDLVEELASQNVKYNPDEMIIIGKDSSGKILWLEKGNERAGLEHIISRHGDEFIQKGIPLDSIPDYLMDSLEYGELIGYQGRGQGRPIYELTVNGEVKRVAITVGDNGFIVGANPVSSK